MYRRELEDGALPEEIRERDSAPQEALFQRASSAVPAPARTNASASKSTAPAKPTSAAPLSAAGLSKKRTYTLANDSNAKPDGIVKCKKRRIDAAGEVDEVEIGFPPGFAVAHPEVVAILTNSIKSVQE